MKLLIADDHALFRDALVQYIERSDPSSSVVLAKDFPEALKLLEADPNQDLILLDLRMPGMNGMEGFSVIKDTFPGARVALMSGVAEEEDIKSAIALGAVGYFPKTMSGRALLGAIEQVVAGDPYIPSGKNSSYMPSYYSDHRGSKKSDYSKKLIVDFTPRESDVLSFLVDGASNKEIARALSLQVVTVKLHVRGICRKLDANNRTQAALKAKEMGVKPASAK